ncbi:MAG: hypothetical protein ACLR23_01605 [Clostridia bacterium]
MNHDTRNLMEQSRPNNPDEKTVSRIWDTILHASAPAAPKRQRDVSKNGSQLPLCSAS